MKHIVALILLLFSYMLCGAQATRLAIDNKVAGTLSQRILYDDKLTVHDIIITGELNGEDLKFLQELNSSYNLTGLIDVSEVHLTGLYSLGNGTSLVLKDNISVTAFQTNRRLKKLVLPKSASKWIESIGYWSSEEFPQLNVDSLIIHDPKFTEIGGIGNPSYLYVGEGVEKFYLNNIEVGCKYTGNVEFYLPSTLKGLYITSSRIGTPDYVTVHAEMRILPKGNSNKPTEEELSFFANGIIYVPEGTKEAYRTSMFQNLEIIAPVSVSGITLNLSQTSLLVGESVKLEAKIIPSNADNQSIEWHSSNNTIATVNSNGVVIANKSGDVTIEASSADNPNIKAVCHISVSQPATGIILNTYAKEIIENESFQLEASVLPVDASNKNVNWTSSDISVAMVSPNGTVYAIKPGQATIMATTLDGGFVALCKITVKEKSILATSIKLSNTSETLTIGETLQLHAILTPEIATNKNINWSSTNSNIATVNNSGYVKAIAEGVTHIIATTTDGSNLSAICNIIVNNNAGIESIIENKNNEVKIFNLNGHLIYKGIYANASISPGIYIVSYDGKYIKVKIDNR